MSIACSPTSAALRQDLQPAKTRAPQNVVCQSSRLCVHYICMYTYIYIEIDFISFFLNSTVYIYIYIKLACGAVWYAFRPSDRPNPFKASLNLLQKISLLESALLYLLATSHHAVKRLDINLAPWQPEVTSRCCRCRCLHV